MEKYADDLARRMREQKKKEDLERLTSAALIRDGVTHSGFRSHYNLRQSLGDSNPQASNLNDTEGFLTSTGRFVDRHQAMHVGMASGQLRSAQFRPLLSSDIDW